MNLQHMKYAIVIAQTQSINKAAEQLYVGQPTLSRAIKELESNLGITLFERSAKGMTLTADGELFIRCAKNVLAQVDDIEKMFGREGTAKRRFSLSAPRAGYVYEAFVRFSCEVGEDTQAELVYRAADTMGALADVEQGRSALGVVRYASHADRYYKEMMEEKGLVCELVAEFRMGILVSRSSPLARLQKARAGGSASADGDFPVGYARGGARRGRKLPRGAQQPVASAAVPARRQPAGNPLAQSADLCLERAASQGTAGAVRPCLARGRLAAGPVPRRAGAPKGRIRPPGWTASSPISSSLPTRGNQLVYGPVFSIVTDATRL